MTHFFTRPRAAGALVAGGIIVMIAAITGWIRADVDSVEGMRQVVLSGSSVAPITTAGALVLLASGCALAFSRRWGARITCGIATLGALTCVVGAVLTMTASTAALTARFSAVTAGTGTISAVTTLPSVWIVAVVSLGCTVVAFAGMLLAHRFPETVCRYDPSHNIPADSRFQSQEDWDALGRGEDPTELRVN
ncbi:MAG: Trp biosynthesis-associated membrane protein [Bowdeniella nasicola]|nr:Trp biosynthesis-associated membrane protein [Bowdeniella nasicola]